MAKPYLEIFSGLVGDVAGVMKNAKDVNKNSASKTLPHPSSRLDFSSSFNPHLVQSRLGGLPLGNFGIPHNLHQQLQISGFPPPAPGSLIYPNQFQNNLNSAVLMASLTNRHDHLRRDGCPPLPSLLPTAGGASPSMANYRATMAAADISRHNDFVSFLHDSSDRQKVEIFSYISKLAAASSISSTSSLSSSSLSSSSSPSSSSSFHFHHQDSPAKSDVSPPDKRSPRPSSLSPSTYMTPRSLNGSPSIGTPNLGTHLSILSPNHINNRAFGNGSPPPLVGSSSSPLGNSNIGIDSTSLTPTRKSSTPKPDKVFPCNVCGRTFGYKHVLQNHERTHTGEKPFECKECRKKFTRDHHLKTHMRLHTGEKPYHCDQCDRHFVQVANLRRHLRVHTGERPYSCESCPSKFSDSNQLKAHLLIHKNEKPFSCNKCTRIFRRRHHLIHHKCSNDSDDEKPLDHIGYGKDIFYSESETTPYREFLNDREENMDDQDEDSLTASTALEDEPLQEKRRGRKSKEPRRVIHQEESTAQTSVNITPPAENRLNGVISNHILPPTPLPEQTEPEDLSLKGLKSRETTYHANISLSTTGYSKNSLRYPKEEIMSDDDGQIPSSL